MLKLSKKWWYALKAVIYIAERDPELLKINDLSEDLHISESLLRRIISDLDKSWILMTQKGRMWWVKLWMELNHISIYDILNSVWEELWITECTKWAVCHNADICNTSDLLVNIQKSFNGILKLNTLDKIINKYEENK